MDSEPCTGDQLPDSEKVGSDLRFNVNMLDNPADDQVARSVIRTEGRHLSRGLQQGAPQTGEACDGLMLVVTLSILK